MHSGNKGNPKHDIATFEFKKKTSNKGYFVASLSFFYISVFAIFLYFRIRNFVLILTVQGYTYGLLSFQV